MSDAPSREQRDRRRIRKRSNGGNCGAVRFSSSVRAIGFWTGRGRDRKRWITPPRSLPSGDFRIPAPAGLLCRLPRMAGSRRTGWKESCLRLAVDGMGARQRRIQGVVGARPQPGGPPTPTSRQATCASTRVVWPVSAIRDRCGQSAASGAADHRCALRAWTRSPDLRRQERVRSPSSRP